MGWEVEMTLSGVDVTEDGKGRAYDLDDLEEAEYFLHNKGVRRYDLVDEMGYRQHRQVGQGD